MTSTKVEGYLFNIAVTGACNLKCPSCPAGYAENFKYTPGNMSAELLDRIMTKAKGECTVDYVGLFHATEPLLHPDLPQLIDVLHKHEIPCVISSNLNIIKNIDAVMESGPQTFIVSVSGFEQSSYGFTHRGGDIEKVKQNMVILAEAWKRSGKKSNLQLTFHRYAGNLDEEMRMRKYAEDLGYSFLPVWAHFLNLEKLIEYIKSGYSMNVFNDMDRQVIDRLVLPYERVARLWESERSRDCFLINGYVALDNQGRVIHCSHDGSLSTIGDYLSMTLDQIKVSKHKSSICVSCKPTGAHNIMNSMCGALRHQDLVKKVDDMAQLAFDRLYMVKAEGM